MKIWKIGFTALAMLVLAGCGQSLSTTKTSYGQNGLVATVKGNAKGAKTVTYQTPIKSGRVKVQNDTFVIDVPVTDKAQQVTLKAAGQEKKVTVKAAKPLGTYKQVAATFNQMVIGSQLSKSDQALLKASQGQTADPTKMTPAQQQQFMQLQKALATAKATTADEQLPATLEDGIQQVTKNSVATTRMSVFDGKLIAAAMIVPVKVMKDEAKVKAFGTQFGLLSAAVGADAQKVGKKFNALAKKAKNGSSQTNIDTITSNGVKFNLGFSTTDIYLYITK